MPNEPLLTRKSYKEQLEKQNRELEELEEKQSLLKEKKSFSLNVRKKLNKYIVLQNQDYESTIIS